MPPKGKQAAKKTEDDLKREDVLQAVLLADSFKVRFRPISAQRPKVLFPLVNIPMIEYTLEFLAAGGVQEIFVLCCAHSDQIKDYIQKSGWSKKAPQLSVKTIISELSHSAGDALRHLETLDVIKGDFILISGDVISNIKLDLVLKAHKERVKADKQNIMTVVFKQVAPDHRSRTLEDDTAVVLSATKQILVYENESSSTHVGFDVSLFEDHSTIQMRYDLMDTHIYICTPQVLTLFTDNFDFQDIRQDFIRGLLGTEEKEILGVKIHAHVISGEYAQRVMDLRTYDAISKDVIHRWTHPIVPDNNLFCQTSYTYSRRNIYKESKNLHLARSCVVEEDTVIGANTSIGEKTLIKQSVIGRNCKIGSNVEIIGSYLWDGCVIEDNVSLLNVVLCDRVTVRANVKLDKGTVLSFGVEIGKGQTVEAYTKLATVVMKEEDAEESDKVASGSEKRVYGGNGIVYEDPEEKDTPFRPNSIAPILPPPPPFEDVYVPEEPEPEPEPEPLEPEQTEEPEQPSVSGQDSKVPETEPEDDLAVPSIMVSPKKTEEAKASYLNEAHETLTRGVAENLELDGIVLELAALKLSHNASLMDYTQAIFYSLFHLAAAGGKGTTSALEAVDMTRPFKVTKTSGEALQNLLTKWGVAIKKFCKEQREQTVTIQGLERTTLMKSGVFEGFFVLTLQALYEDDVISEESILEWEQLKKKSTTGDNLLQKAGNFLQWLKNADEEE